MCGASETVNSTSSLQMVLQPSFPIDIDSIPNGNFALDITIVQEKTVASSNPPCIPALSTGDMAYSPKWLGEIEHRETALRRHLLLPEVKPGGRLKLVVVVLFRTG